jgi:cytochrome c553
LFAPGLLAIVMGLVSVTAAKSADARAGRAKATTCQACHGLDGLSKHPEAPNLAGQIENYLAKATTSYRTGERKNELMNIVARDLSDEDIADLAAFYAGIEIEVIPR